MSDPHPDPSWSEAALAGWQAVVDHPAGAVVALDFDGTLAPIVDDPTRSRAADGVVEVLSALAERVRTVAVVTGRGAGTAVEVGGFGDVEGLLVLGHYGLERWEGGVLDAPEPADGVERVRAALPEVLRDAADGVFVEDKRHSLVVHTRPAADPGGALAALADALHQLADRHGLEVVPGRMVAELRPPGVDKGSAVAALTEGATALLVAGDDLGDLPAFAEVARGRAAGRPGLSLGSSGGPGQHAAAEVVDAVDLVLDGPDEVVALLAQLVQAIDRGGLPY